MSNSKFQNASSNFFQEMHKIVLSQTNTSQRNQKRRTCFCCDTFDDKTWYEHKNTAAHYEKEARYYAFLQESSKINLNTLVQCVSLYF